MTSARETPDASQLAENPSVARASRPAAVLVSCLAVAVVLLVAAATVLGPKVWLQQGEQARDRAVLDLARQTVLTMLTVDQADPRATLDRLLAVSAGEFKQQLVSQSDVFTQGVAGAKATATGSINEIGIRAVRDDEASVLVSAVSEVRNTQVPAGQSRQYRMFVGLRKEGAVWRVTKVDFRP